MVMRTVELTASLSSITLQGPIDLSAVEDVNLHRGAGEGLLRRVVAVSEGVWNGIEFSADEIRKMVDQCVQSKTNSFKGDYYPVPIILDHSDKYLDKVGGTVQLGYSMERTAAIADIHLWEDDAVQKAVIARIQRDPENTFFSVRVRGQLGESKLDNAWAKLSDMQLIHLAIVNEPACSEATIIGELTAEEQKRYEAMEGCSMNEQPSNPTAVPEKTDNAAAGDIHLNNGAEKPMPMPTVEELQKEVENLRKQSETLQAEITTLKGDLAAKTTEATELAKAKDALSGDVVALKKDNDAKQAEIAQLKADNAATLEKLPMVTEILAANPALKQETLFGLKKEQLADLKETLIAPGKTADNHTVQKSVDASTAAAPAEKDAKTALSEYAQKAFGAINH